MDTICCLRYSEVWMQTAFITQMRESLSQRDVYFRGLVEEEFLQSKHPRTNKLKIYIYLSHLYPTLTLPVCLSSSPSPSPNLRRVSSSATPPSVGLQLVKQRHLITAEATQSYVCLCMCVCECGLDAGGRKLTIVSKLPGLCPLHCLCALTLSLIVLYCNSRCWPRSVAEKD